MESAACVPSKHDRRTVAPPGRRGKRKGRRGRREEEGKGQGRLNVGQREGIREEERDQRCGRGKRARREGEGKEAGRG